MTDIKALARQFVEAEGTSDPEALDVEEWQWENGLGLTEYEVEELNDEIHGNGDLT